MIVATITEKTKVAFAPSIKWATDPHAEVFFMTIAEIIREIENPEWLRNNQKPQPLLPPVTAENHQ